MKMEKTNPSISQLEKSDPLFRIKSVAYHMVKLGKDFGKKDFVRMAKFYLCVKNHKLMKDPIWNEYTDEAVLSEYFAHIFSTNDELLTKFEFALEMGKSEVDDFAAWADREIEKSQKELGKLEDRIVFDPSDVMGD